MNRLPITLLLVALAAAYIEGAAVDQSTESSSQQTTTTKPTTQLVDLNKTISEVEKILGKYPELPRIDRSEILSILQNITEEDNAKLKEELTGVLEEEKQKMQQNKENKESASKNSSRTEGNRSVMVVMPFKATDDDQESLEELYTRSPVVVMEEQRDPVIRVTTYSPQRRTSTTVKPTEAPTYSIVEKQDPKFNPPLRVIGFRYHTTPGPKHLAGEDSSRSYTNFQDPEQVTMAFRTQEVKASHLWNHKVAQTTPEKLDDIVFAANSKPGTVWDDEPPVKPTGTSQKFHVPDAMDNFSIEDAIMQNSEENEDTTTVRYIPEVIFTKPETTTAKVYITSAKTSRRKFSTTTTAATTTTTEESFWTTQAPKKKHRTKTKLVEKTTKAPVAVQQDVDNVLNNLPPHMREMLSNIGINGGLSFTGNTDAPPAPIRTANAPIDPSSYQNFKFLPYKRQKTVSDDMQQFLASFGLLEGNRQQKAHVETTTPFNDLFLQSAPKINPDFLTDNMKKTLDSLGLYDAPPKKHSREHIFNPKNLTAIQSDVEIKKLNTLLTTIKKLASLNDSEPVTPEFQREILQQVKDLDNITISYKTSAAINEEIHKIMERNKGKFKIPVIMTESSAINTLQPGLNPEYYEEIELKNEVKRQENSTSADDTSSTTEGSTTSTTEPANSAALEDAFGGGDTAPADSDPSESLPPKRPNGLYLLLDWNTFFEVGTEDDSRRVNIRFQPKIGDGRNFLPVTIP